MTNPLTPATNAGSHGGALTSPGFLRRWRIPMIAGGVMVVGAAIALGQQWLTVAALVPLLYVLPCAVMMFVCMRHMNHGQPSDPTPALSDRGERSTTDARG